MWRILGMKKKTKCEVKLIYFNLFAMKVTVSNILMSLSESTKTHSSNSVNKQK